jgi:hypothetical protein
MTATIIDLPPRRLVLAAAELELLRRLAGDLPLPADFAVERPAPSPAAEPAADGEARGISVDSAALAAATRSLSDGGVLQADPERPRGVEPHPSVVASLQVLAAPEVLIETRLRTSEHTVRAAHAVAAGLGASLARLADTATVELSIFPAERLGLELIRMVPAVGSAARGAQRPSGLIPLDALAQLGLAAEIGGNEVVQQIAADLRLTASEQAAARAFTAQVNGVLHGLVTAPPRPAPAAGRIGQVLWYATPGGWVGLDSQPVPDGRRTVRLSPADPIDLGAWVAPLIAGALA